jgi:hypothetical protein
LRWASSRERAAIWDSASDWLRAIDSGDTWVTETHQDKKKLFTGSWHIVT